MARLVPVLAAAVCLAGVALGSIHILCGKRGTWRHRPSLCGRRGNFGTGLALVARLVPVVAAAVCRIWTHRPPFSVVGAALGDIGIHFVWQAWHLWHWAGSGGALGFRRGAGDAAAVGVAGVALRDIYLHFVWQAWHLTTSIVTLRGRRGTYGTGLALVARLVPRPRWDAAAFCVAGVALCDIHLHFVWQAWHFMTWIVTLRGRRGTYGTGLALVARLGPS